MGYKFELNVPYVDDIACAWPFRLAIVRALVVGDSIPQPVRDSRTVIGNGPFQ